MHTSRFWALTLARRLPAQNYISESQPLPSPWVKCTMYQPWRTEFQQPNEMHRVITQEAARQVRAWPLGAIVTYLRNSSVEFSCLMPARNIPLRCRSTSHRYMHLSLTKCLNTSNNGITKRRPINLQGGCCHIRRQILFLVHQFPC